MQAGVTSPKDGGDSTTELKSTGVGKTLDEDLKSSVAKVTNNLMKKKRADRVQKGLRKETPRHKVAVMLDEKVSDVDKNRKVQQGNRDAEGIPQ